MTMKKLINTIEVHELRAKRALFLKKARELEKQAAKFRVDALQAGCQLHELGEHQYVRHPAYQDLVYPALRQARNISINAGFDILFQVRTPLAGNPDWTEGIAGVHNEPTETMGKCIELIKARPELVVRSDKIISHAPAEVSPVADSDNSEKSER
jgi:hypothetical protein